MKLTDGLYTVIEKNSEVCIIALSDKEHPIFKAHFPTYPILPGFLQIDIAEELIEKSFQKLKKVKFIQPVEPSAQLHYRFFQNKIAIYENNKKISEFTYE